MQVQALMIGVGVVYNRKRRGLLLNCHKRAAYPPLQKSELSLLERLSVSELSEDLWFSTLLL